MEVLPVFVLAFAEIVGPIAGTPKGRTPYFDSSANVWDSCSERLRESGYQLLHGRHYKSLGPSPYGRDAEAICIREGGHLPTLRTQEDVEDIHGLRDQIRAVWVGLSRKKSQEVGEFTCTDATCDGLVVWGDVAPFRFEAPDGTMLFDKVKFDDPAALCARIVVTPFQRLFQVHDIDCDAEDTSWFTHPGGPLIICRFCGCPGEDPRSSHGPRMDFPSAR